MAESNFRSNLAGCAFSPLSGLSSFLFPLSAPHTHVTFFPSQFDGHKARPMTLKHPPPNRPPSPDSLLHYPLESHFVQPNAQTKKKRPFPSHSLLLLPECILTRERDEMRCSRYFALSRWERFLGFLICSAGAAACFALSFFIGLPLLAVKPRKFAVCPLSFPLPLRNQLTKRESITIRFHSP